MSMYICKCDRCGKLFRANLRKRIVMQREISPNKWRSDTFSRYYCDECATLVKSDVLRFEDGGKR